MPAHINIYIFLKKHKSMTGKKKLLCQYNNIYAGSYKYLKEKKSTKGRLKKKNDE